MMKKIKENLFNFIAIILMIYIAYLWKVQLKWIIYTIHHMSTFRFKFPFITSTIVNDTLFTIAIGRSVVENGFTNFDTLTWHDNLAFPHSGIFDLIIYGVYNITNDVTSIYIYTAIMTFILVSILFFITYKENKNILASIIFSLVVLYLGRKTFNARAYQFSFIFFALEYYFIKKLRQEGKYKYSFILFLLGVLTANIHSSVYLIYIVMFLPHIAEIYLSKLKWKIPKLSIISENGDKTFIRTVLICIFTGLITTTGFSAYTDMIKAMMGISSQFIGELERSNIYNNREFFIILGVTIIIILFSKKIRITDLLYIAGFGILTLLCYRGFYFFLFISGISITNIIINFFKDSTIKVNKNIALAFNEMLFILFILSTIFQTLRVMDNDLLPQKSYPIGVCEFILENLDVDKIRVYNDFNYGSYLEYKGIKAFIDSRSGMYTEEFNPGCTILSDWYIIFQDVNRYKEVFDKYDFTHVIVRHGMNLSNILCDNDEWICIYNDNIWELYQKEPLKY